MALAPNIHQDINTLCRSTCVDHYKHDGNPQEQVCPVPSDYHGPCRNPAQHDQAVYDRFGPNWNRVAGKIVRGFIDRGLDDAHNIFRGMIHVLFPLSNYTFNINFDAGIQYTKCNDIVCSYQIANKLNMGAHTQYFNLFHISLHSAKPIYFEGSTRRVFSCAPYPALGQNQGAFHYKIDSDRNLHNLPSKPYRRLMSRHDGRFEPSQHSFEIDKTNQQEINYAIFHEYIYHRFIIYWNSCIEYVILHPNTDNDESPWSATPNPNRIHDIRIEDTRDNPASIDRALTAALRSAAPANVVLLNHTITRNIPNQLIAATDAIDAVRAAASIGKKERARAIREARAQDPSKVITLSNLKRLGNERRERETALHYGPGAASAAASAPQRSKSPVLPVETQAEVQEKIALAASAKKLAELAEQQAVEAEAAAIREMINIESKLKSAKKGRAELELSLASKKREAETAKRSLTRARDKAKHASLSFNRLSRLTLRKSRSRSRSLPKSQSRSRSRSRSRSPRKKNKSSSEQTKKNTRRR